MSCLFAGNLAGNYDAAVDTWPVIRPSTLPYSSASELARFRHAAADLERSQLATPLGRGAADPHGGGAGSSGLYKDGRDEANMALSPTVLWLVVGDSDAGTHTSVVETLSKRCFRWACHGSKG